MIAFFSHLDTILFYFFNQTLSNPVFDYMMPVITNKWTWAPVWIILIAGILIKGGRRDKWILFMAILSVALADMVGHRVMKKNIQRIRPCNALENVHLLVKKNSSYSMPSNHAANFFALAAIFGFFYRRYRIGVYAIAGLVGYSRIAVGVHYPFDVLVGALLGVFLAMLVILFFKYGLKIQSLFGEPHA